VATHTQANGGRGTQLQGRNGDEEWGDVWDETCSLFDNHMSSSYEKNLEYMFKHFGFQFPNPESLKDPKGLLKYLGAKLQHGRLALYSRGDDDAAKVFPSLHAVQRHMVDTARCNMCYDGNEGEYEDFYDYRCAHLVVTEQ
jgi:pre-60S factor REI1